MKYLGCSSGFVFISLNLLFNANAYSYEIYNVSDETLATCGDLSEIAYWAATANFSATDENKLILAKKNAGKANNLRAAISPEIIAAAVRSGVTSHGNAGEGNSNINAARSDAILSATGTYAMCLDGRIIPDELKVQSSAYLKTTYEEKTCKLLIPNFSHRYNVTNVEWLHLVDQEDQSKPLITCMYRAFIPNGTNGPIPVRVTVLLDKAKESFTVKVE